MDLQQLIYTIAQCLPGFLLAIVLHEAAHAYVAMKFGDDTAERIGRLSLNPAVHFDMMGTVIFPLISLSLGGIVFGWAKPVPIDSRNFKNYRKGLFWVSFAGPLSNFILGTISAFLYAVVFTNMSVDSVYMQHFLKMLEYSVLINFILGGFNLIPLPPLDGSKMVASFLKHNALRKYEEIAAYTPYIFLGLIALSFMGIHILGYILMPVYYSGEILKRIFISMLL
ncbi:MAG: site-2 protease family protein [Halobacteriovoraceae bacterium]|nr:site-2 protease family protein [Halobacteriovoraceae bacterium]